MPDTRVVSILFKPDHSLHQQCFRSFMTPRRTSRREELTRHIDLSTTLLLDEDTCAVRAGIMAESRIAGRQITAADALSGVYQDQSAQCSMFPTRGLAARSGRIRAISE